MQKPSNDMVVGKPVNFTIVPVGGIRTKALDDLDSKDVGALLSGLFWSSNHPSDALAGGLPKISCYMIQRQGDPFAIPKSGIP